jgi:hypothetical protein
LVTDLGGYVRPGVTLSNVFHAELTPSGLDALAAHDDVRRIELMLPTENDTNGGRAIRHADQTHALLDAGFDGDEPSGRDPFADNIVVAVFDGWWDEDHPSYDNRLVKWAYWNGAALEFTVATTESSATSNDMDTGDGEDWNHGSMVMGLLLSNGFDDAGLSSETNNQRLDKSGHTPKSSFYYHMWFDPTDENEQAQWDDRAERAIELAVDVVNNSNSLSGTSCDNDASQNEQVDLMFHDGIFVVTTPGNTGHASGCSIRTPGLASAAFTPGAYDSDPSVLNEAEIMHESPRGGDPDHGRAGIDLVAAESREGENTSEFDNAYVDADSIKGTSYAAPLMAAAAADLKHEFPDLFGPTAANSPGRLFATMLLMGDGQLETSPFDPDAKADATDLAPDEIWGMGRMRMRAWTNTWMDAPWAAGVTSFVLADGNTHTMQIQSGNTLPSSTDTLRVAVYWFEPNLGSTETPADIAIELCDDATPTPNCYDSLSTAPGERRLIAPSPGGSAWELHFDGVDIPASTDVDYLHNQTKRVIHVAVMHEDQQRDDANGPDCYDEIDIDCISCCASQPGGTCTDTGLCP